MKNERKILNPGLLLLLVFFFAFNIFNISVSAEGAGNSTTPITYTVWFNSNGQSVYGYMSYLQCEVGKEYQLPKCELTKNAYRFTGWNTSADGTGTAFADEATFKDLTTEKYGRVTLYAQWEVDYSSCPHSGFIDGSYVTTHLEITKEATSTEWGEYQKKCDFCGAALETKEIHPYDTYQVVTSDGTVEEVCGWFDSEYSQEVFRQLNQYRSENGLNTLSYNYSLEYASNIRAVECYVYFSHTRPDGTRWNTVTSQWTNGGENLASGYQTPSDVMVGWKNSPSHNRNMLYGLNEGEVPYKGISVGCLHVMRFIDGIPWSEVLTWTQHFTFYEADPNEETVIPQPEEGRNVSDVEAFVTRLYNIALDREPDEAGLRDWSDSLLSGEKNAVNIVQGFFGSAEYNNKGKSNGEKVTDCYRAMLGREPDAGGYENWVSLLDAGMTMESIYAGFVGSPEFVNLCNSYGINAGTYTVTQPRDMNAGITKFVSRCYTKVLGRQYDDAGLNDWCNSINNDKSRENIMYVATNGFFHSQEFMNKNLDDTEFVKVLYRAFLDREYDEPGLNDWVSQLNAGKSRDEVMAGFAYSQEFSNIMADYGL